LIYLVLQECLRDDELIKLFVDNFQNFQDLRMLNLKQNNITEIGVKHLIQNLNKFPNLKSIDFSKNKFYDQGLINFSR
jgi:Ran GTPase-activating protein (RanGAP) involved in mRNA processing and transport